MENLKEKLLTDTEGRFTVTFPLKTEIYQEHILEKRFNTACHIYNMLKTKMDKKYREMTKTKHFRGIISERNDLYKTNNELKKSISNKNSKKDKNDIKEIKLIIKENEKRIKELNKQVNDIYKENNFTKFGFMTEVKEYAKIYKKVLDGNTARNEALNLWRAYETYLFGSGTETKYKSRKKIRSVAGIWNKSGIKVKEIDQKFYVVWDKLTIPIVVKKNNPYEDEALLHEIALNRILKKEIKGKTKYYVQIVFKGSIPSKRDKKTGDFKYQLGNGKVGVYLGVKDVTIVTDNKIIYRPLAPQTKDINEELEKLHQLMDSSRRATNPQNFEDDGTIKSVKKGEKRVWTYSNNYKKYKATMTELHRKQTVKRKQEHEILANEILQLGNEFTINILPYKNFQKDNGSLIGLKAPSEFLNILIRKIEGKKGIVNKIEFNEQNIENLNVLKINDLTHEDSIIRKPIDETYDEIDSIKIPKKMYNAFLLKNMNSDKTINKENITNHFENFKENYLVFEQTTSAIPFL